MKYPLVVTGLLLLLVANVLIFMRFSARLGFREGFQNTAGTNAQIVYPPAGTPGMGGNARGGPAGNVNMPTGNMKEGFSSYLLANAAGSKSAYEPMGAYDGVALSTGNDVSSWRYTAPNEKLMGEEFAPGQDSLFMFKNNQCKPECCGASFSCGGGCVCTTPQQRQYLAGRGGNRTAPEDSA